MHRSWAWQSTFCLSPMDATCSTKDGKWKCFQPDESEMRMIRRMSQDNIRYNIIQLTILVAELEYRTPNSFVGLDWTPPNTTHETRIRSLLPTVGAGPRPGASHHAVMTPVTTRLVHREAFWNMSIMSQGVKQATFAQDSHIKPQKMMNTKG